MDLLAQAGFVNREPASLESFDLVDDLVDANDVVAAFRQAGALNQPHITRSDDCDFHDATLSTVRRPDA